MSTLKRFIAGALMDRGATIFGSFVRETLAGEQEHAGDIDVVMAESEALKFLSGAASWSAVKILPLPKAATPDSYDWTRDTWDDPYDSPVMVGGDLMESHYLRASFDGVQVDFLRAVNWSRLDLDVNGLTMNLNGVYGHPHTIALAARKQYNIVSPVALNLKRQQKLDAMVRRGWHRYPNFDGGLVKTYDPEFERLLMEEEDIERRSRRNRTPRSFLASRV